MLFPESDKLILNDLVDAFNKWEKDESTKDRVPDYILYLRNTNDKFRLNLFVDRMRERINSAGNFKSLKEMHGVLHHVGFENIGGLDPFYEFFAREVRGILLEKQYKVSYEENHLIS